MKAGQLMKVLVREPLNYTVARQHGSHRLLVSGSDYPTLMFSFHDGVTVAPGLVRKVLVKDVGLTDDEALGILRG